MAQYRYERRRKNCGRKPILSDDESRKLIQEKLCEEWLPEQIQYRLKLEENPVQVSYATIYRALNSGLIEILLAVKTPNETAEAVRNSMIRMFSKIPAEKIRSITPERGHEFAEYAEVNDALHGVPFYFADPHSPWQRGNKLYLTKQYRIHFSRRTRREKFPAQSSAQGISLAQKGRAFLCEVYFPACVSQ